MLILKDIFTHKVVEVKSGSNYKDIFQLFALFSSFTLNYLKNLYHLSPY